jgi:hypothetical protein
MNVTKALLIALLTVSFLFILVALYRVGLDRSPAQHLLTPGVSADITDGRGSATVDPADPVRALERGTWTVTYVADSTGIVEGGGIVFQVSPFWGWSGPQDKDPDRPGFTTIRTNRPDVRLELQGSALHYLLIDVAEGRLAGGDTVQIVYGDTGGGAHPKGAAYADRFAERGEEFLLKVDGNGDRFFAPVPGSPTIDIRAREAVRLAVRAPALVTAGDPFEVHVAALDPLDNWDRSFTGTITLASEGAVDLPDRVELTPAGNAVAVVTATARAAGRFRIRASATNGADGALEGWSEPILCVSDPPEYGLYWGDLHGHSGLSDGTGTPDDYYDYARWVSGLDVSVLTDHDAHGLLPLDENPRLWREIVDAANRHYAPGAFVTYPAYEWTSWTWGHRHVLFPGEVAELYSFRDERSDTPAELHELLGPLGAIAIPHHPAGGPIAIDWESHDDASEPLVEICSVHGNSDAPGQPLQIYRSEEGRFVTDGLRRGFTFGILASGDTHDGHPGRQSAGAPSMGLAGIRARSLDREGIWEALLARRVYGTSGPRIVLGFRMHGHRMGSVVPIDAPSGVDGEIFVSGTSRVERVELLEDEAVVRTFAPEEDPATIRFRRRVEPPAVYRVRVFQEDGGMAWSSPIWFRG